MRSEVGGPRKGKQFMANVLPKQSKLVKELMRDLGRREQETLSRICRKLRAGDVVKFIKEIRMEDED